MHSNGNYINENEAKNHSRKYRNENIWFKVIRAKKTYSPSFVWMIAWNKYFPLLFAKNDYFILIASVTRMSFPTRKTVFGQIKNKIEFFKETRGKFSYLRDDSLVLSASYCIPTSRFVTSHSYFRGNNSPSIFLRKTGKRLVNNANGRGRHKFPNRQRITIGGWKLMEAETWGGKQHVHLFMFSWR